MTDEYQLILGDKNVEQALQGCILVAESVPQDYASWEELFKQYSKGFWAEIITRYALRKSDFPQEATIAEALTDEIKARIEAPRFEDILPEGMDFVGWTEPVREAVYLGRPKNKDHMFNLVSRLDYRYHFYRPQDKQMDRRWGRLFAEKD